MNTLPHKTWEDFNWLLTEMDAEDDPKFWEAAINHIFTDIETDCQKAKKGVFAEVGRSSQWMRPHQTRWTADGGFAWPAGYGEASLNTKYQSSSYSTRRGNPNATQSYSKMGLPAFDWFDRWERQPDGSWKPSDPRERIKPKQFLVRVTLPGRTNRHLQGVVHTIWTKGHPTKSKKVFKFYGFRNQDDGWNCTATYDGDG